MTKRILFYTLAALFTTFGILTAVHHLLKFNDLELVTNENSNISVQQSYYLNPPDGGGGGKEIAWLKIGKNEILCVGYKKADRFYLLRSPSEDKLGLSSWKQGLPAYDQYRNRITFLLEGLWVFSVCAVLSFLMLYWFRVSHEKRNN